jgi:hypothetical protein
VHLATPTLNVPLLDAGSDFWLSWPQPRSWADQDNLKLKTTIMVGGTGAQSGFSFVNWGDSKSESYIVDIEATVVYGNDGNFCLNPSNHDEVPNYDKTPYGLLAGHHAGCGPLGNDAGLSHLAASMTLADWYDGVKGSKVPFGGQLSVMDRVDGYTADLYDNQMQDN